MPLPTHEDEKQHPKRETSRKQRGRARCRVDEVERKATFHTGPKAERGQKGGQRDILAPRASWIWTIISVAASAAAQTQSGAPSISVEQRIEAATRALGYFARSHEYNEFRSVLLTLLEVNGDDNAAAPRNERWDVREQQIKETYGAWFQIFRALDALKRANYDPFDKANRCYLSIAPARGFPGMDPKDVSDPQERGAYELRGGYSGKSNSVREEQFAGFVAAPGCGGASGTAQVPRKPVSQRGTGRRRFGKLFRVCTWENREHRGDVDWRLSIGRFSNHFRRGL